MTAEDEPGISFVRRGSLGLGSCSRLVLPEWSLAGVNEDQRTLVLIYRPPFGREGTEGPWLTQPFPQPLLPLEHHSELVIPNPDQHLQNYTSPSSSPSPLSHERPRIGIRDRDKKYFCMEMSHVSPQVLYTPSPKQRRLEYRGLV